MKLAPVALFAYRRPLHLQKVVESLLGNELASETDLVVFSDAARKPADQEAVDQVRRYLRTIGGFRSVRLVERRTNFGLSKSIISGVSELVQKYGRIIVLEDDIVVSSHFLTFMNRNLELYALDEKVGAVTGYCFPLGITPPDTWFMDASSCWGWGTWDRAWKEFNPVGNDLLRSLRQKKLLFKFDFNGNYPYTGMLKDQIKGKNDSWAVRWYASTFLKGLLTLFPGKSLVANIGWDGTGENCGIEKMDIPEFDSHQVQGYSIIETVIDPKLQYAVHKSVIPSSFSSLKILYYRLNIARKRWL